MIFGELLKKVVSGPSWRDPTSLSPVKAGDSLQFLKRPLQVRASGKGKDRETAFSSVLKYGQMKVCRGFLVSGPFVALWEG